ncbi:hypothetical protein WMY93_014828 [Mugilogobius chulae]|uniref:Immunoglobulin domain-containing protein n=1 Tax=Mugilogobius chulae TaxID=88201 RepID=A0AAW0NXZ6_9GOBI
MRLNSISALLLLLCVRASFSAKVFEVTEGEDLRLKCSFYSYGHWRYFCRNDCHDHEDFLVISAGLEMETDGRFTLEYERRPSYPDVMYVIIRNVQRSDAGHYKCGLLDWSSDPEWTTEEVIIYVTIAVNSDSAAGIMSREAQQDDTTQSAGVEPESPVRWSTDKCTEPKGTPALAQFVCGFLYLRSSSPLRSVIAQSHADSPGLQRDCSCVAVRRPDPERSADPVSDLHHTALETETQNKHRTCPGRGNTQILESSHEEADSRQSRAADGELSSVCFSNPTHTDSH